MLKKYLCHHPKIASQIIEKEAFIITLCNNTLYSLNTTGTKIWQLANGKFKVFQIIDKITEEFEVSYEKAKTDVIEFIEIMLSKKMVILKDDSTKKENSC